MKETIMQSQQEITNSVVANILSGNLSGAEKNIEALLSIKAYELSQSHREAITPTYLNQEAINE